MALSKRTKNCLENALADRRSADEVIAALEAAADEQAGAVAALGATVNLSALAPAAASISASAGTYVIPAEPTGAEVDAAIDALKDKVITALGLKADNADAETLRTEVEARLDAAEAKIDAVIAAFKASGQMAS